MNTPAMACAPMTARMTGSCDNRHRSGDLHVIWNLHRRISGCNWRVVLGGNPDARARAVDRYMRYRPRRSGNRDRRQGHAPERRREPTMKPLLLIGLAVLVVGIASLLIA